MSLNIKTTNGLQRIAGSTVILDATTSEVRSGTFRLSGTSWVAQNITFTTPMPDTNYIVNIEPDNLANLANSPFRISDKTVNGFKLSIYTTSSTAITYSGTYYAIRLVELEGYTELQNKVNNPDSSPTENSTNLVTSGGVYEAIQNATKVFIGTEQEWEDETDKTKYQLAVLTDRTQINSVDETTGNTETVADYTGSWIGTTAEWEALSAAEKAEYKIVNITDDYESEEVITVDITRTGAADGSVVVVKKFGRVVYGNLSSLITPSTDSPANVSMFSGLPRPVRACRFVALSLGTSLSGENSPVLFQVREDGVLITDGLGAIGNTNFWGSFVYLTND